MFDKQVETLETRLKTAWMDRTPIAWEGTPFNPVRGQPFIRVTITWGDSQFISDLISRESGIMMVEVLTPLDQGSEAGRGYADAVAGIFHMWHKNRVYVKVPYAEREGEVEEWYKLVVYLPFHCDVVRQ